MARNLEGEFELILGNKQLLSLFFLVVVLFAVFFSLGYMVGKSVSPAPAMAAEPAAPAPSADQPTADKPSPLPAETAPTAQPAAVAETQPAASEPSSSPAAAPPAAAPAPSEPAAPARTEPAAPLVARDLHLQIAAVRVREDAEALVENLRKKGYAVSLNSQTRDGWYRVIVGPFANERAAQDMKARLEKDGYKSILKKP